MKIQLTEKEVLDILHDAFCNGGLSDLAMCEVMIQWEHPVNSKAYDRAKKALNSQIENGITENVYVSVVDETPTICTEDIYTHILRIGGKLVFTDYNDNDSVYLTLEKALENLNKSEGFMVQEIVTALYDKGQADAVVAFNILQQALYAEIIYG